MTKDDIVRVGEFLTALEAEIKRTTLAYWNKCTDLLDGPVEDVCGLCSKFDGLEEEQNAHLSKVFDDAKTFVNSLTKVKVSLTKEELERLVLPLEWMDDEDDHGNPLISSFYGQYEALIKETRDGSTPYAYGYTGTPRFCMNTQVLLWRKQKLRLGSIRLSTSEVSYC